MRAQIRLLRIAGIELGLHYSWFVIALLITFSLAAHFRFTNPDWSRTTVWATALITGVLFFAGLFLHELSHAFVAKARGLPIRRITLFVFGGMAQIEKEATDAKTESRCWPDGDGKAPRTVPASRLWSGSGTSTCCWARST